MLVLMLERKKSHIDCCNNQDGFLLRILLFDLWLIHFSILRREKQYANMFEKSIFEELKLNDK